ncbi:MAG: hypothetical protein JW703_04980 [Candidatus Diapherotrites archaeon]|nr:hypothetical protein [Candidatus Diapherotrites archaeon]
MASIYEEKKTLDFGFPTEKTKKIGSTLFILLLVLLAIALIVIGTQSVLEKKPIELNFEKNPIKVTQENVILNAKIINTTSMNSEQVIVTAKPRGSIPLTITVERNGLIGSIAAGEERRIKILINPVQGILPGNYIIDVTAKISNQQFSKSITLTIEE